MKKAILLDTSAIMYRSYFANINLKNKDLPTGAIYGFLNSLMSTINQFKPNLIVAAFDVKKSTLKRTELYNQYKDGRASMPEDLALQIPYVEKLLDIFKIQKIKIDGYEADDVIASLSKKLKKDNYEVVVITGDKDLAQIVSENISVAVFSKDKQFNILSNDEDVKNFLGVPASYIPDFFGLVGDEADNIPGVPKIGEVKAVAIFEKYKNLEEIYSNLEKLQEIQGIGKGLIKNLQTFKEDAFMSRELAKVVYDLDVDLTLQELNYDISADVDRLELLNFLKDLNFKSIINKYKLDKIQDEDIKIYSDEKISFKIIENLEDLNLLKTKIEKSQITSVYFEKVGFSISIKDENFYISVFHREISTFNIPFDNIKDFFKSINKKFISFNFKEFYKLGIDIKKDLDIMIAHHLVSSQTKTNINEVLSFYISKNLTELKEILLKREIENISSLEIAKYMTEKSHFLLRIYDEIKNKLEELNLLEIYEKIEYPLIKVLAYMEKNGIKIDIPYFNKLESNLADEIIDLEKNIFLEADEKFNINSPKQLASILFEKMNLEATKKTKTGYSTDVEVLEDLSSKGVKIAKFLLEHRKLTKLKNTYVDTLPKLVDENSRIHTTYNQVGTATGRLSSNDPNLQNIPVKTDDGIKIREGFIANKGNLFMSVDYSQVELRVLASLSKDEKLIKTYKENKDLHKLTAIKIFDLNEDDEVTRMQRTMAKIVNFSVIYGKTPFGLSKELGISVQQATTYIKKYFEEYKDVAKFEKEIIDFAEKHSYVQTKFGRKRYIDGINSKNKNIKASAERMAVNTVIQGTAAEILKKVMLNIYDFIKDKDDIKLLLQVHDELIFEIKEESLEKYRDKISDIMKNSVLLDDVILDINISIGENWAKAK